MMTWLVFIVRLAIFACLLHPAVLAAILTLLASIALIESGKSLSFKRVNVFKLCAEGVVAEVKASSTRPGLAFRCDAIALEVQLFAVVLSWFEERPFCLHVTRPCITASRPPKVTSAATNKATSTPTAGLTSESILETALRDPRRLRMLVALARLLKLVVSEPSAEETLEGSGLVRTVTANRVALQALYTPPIKVAEPASPGAAAAAGASGAGTGGSNSEGGGATTADAAPGGTLRVTSEVRLLEAHAGGAALSEGMAALQTSSKVPVAAPASSIANSKPEAMPQIKCADSCSFSVEVDLARRLVLDVGVKFGGPVEVSGGVCALAVASKLANNRPVAPGNTPRAATSSGADTSATAGGAVGDGVSEVAKASPDAGTDAPPEPQALPPPKPLNRRDLPRRCSLELAAVVLRCADDYGSGSGCSALDSSGASENSASTAKLCSELVLGTKAVHFLFQAAAPLENMNLASNSSSSSDASSASSTTRSSALERFSFSLELGTASASVHACQGAITSNTVAIPSSSSAVGNSTDSATARPSTGDSSAATPANTETVVVSGAGGSLRGSAAVPPLLRRNGASMWDAPMAFDWDKLDIVLGPDALNTACRFRAVSTAIAAVTSSSPAAAATVTSGKTSEALGPLSSTLPSAPLSSPSVLPALWPRQVRLGCKSAELSLVDLHGPPPTSTELLRPPVHARADNSSTGNSSPAATAAESNLSNRKPKGGQTLSSSSTTSSSSFAGAACLQQSCAWFAASSVKVHLDAAPAPLFTWYDLAASAASTQGTVSAWAKVNTVTAREHDGSGEESMNNSSGGYDAMVIGDLNVVGAAEIARRAAVLSGATGLAGSGQLGLKMASGAVAVSGVLNGRLKERLDKVHVHNLALHEIVAGPLNSRSVRAATESASGASDAASASAAPRSSAANGFLLVPILSAPSVRVTAAMAEADLRQCPNISFNAKNTAAQGVGEHQGVSSSSSSAIPVAAAVECAWSGASQVRLIRLLSVAMAAQSRALKALFPPKPKLLNQSNASTTATTRRAPVAVQVHLQGGFKATLHADAHTRLIVTAQAGALSQQQLQQQSSRDNAESAGDGSSSSNGGEDITVATVEALSVCAESACSGACGSSGRSTVGGDTASPPVAAAAAVLHSPPLLRCLHLEAVRTLTPPPSPPPPPLCSACDSNPAPPAATSAAATAELTPHAASKPLPLSALPPAEAYKVTTKGLQLCLPPCLEFGDFLDAFLAQESACRSASVACTRGIGSLDLGTSTTVSSSGLTSAASTTPAAAATHVATRNPALVPALALSSNSSSSSSSDGYLAAVSVAAAPARWASFNWTAEDGVDIELWGGACDSGSSSSTPTSNDINAEPTLEMSQCWCLAKFRASHLAVASEVVRDPYELARELQRLDPAVCAHDGDDNGKQSMTLPTAASTGNKTHHHSASGQEDVKRAKSPVYAFGMVMGSRLDLSLDHASFGLCSKPTPSKSSSSNSDGFDSSSSSSSSMSGSDKSTDEVATDELVGWESLRIVCAPAIAASLAALPHLSESKAVPLFHSSNGAQATATDFNNMLMGDSAVAATSPDSVASAAAAAATGSGDISGGSIADGNCYPVMLLSAKMPQKLYLDPSLHFQGLRVAWNGASYPPQLDAVAAAVKRFTPSPPPQEIPASDDKRLDHLHHHSLSLQPPPPPVLAPPPPPPLPWWDTRRLQLHGPMRLVANDATLKLVLAEPPKPAHLLAREAREAAAAAADSSGASKPTSSRRARSGSLAMPPPLPPRPQQQQGGPSQVLSGSGATPGDHEGASSHSPPPPRPPPLPAPCVMWHVNRLEYLEAPLDPSTLSDGAGGNLRDAPASYIHNHGLEPDSSSKSSFDGSGNFSHGNDGTSSNSSSGKSSKIGSDKRRDVHALSLTSVTLSVPAVAPSDWWPSSDCTSSGDDDVKTTSPSGFCSFDTGGGRSSTFNSGSGFSGSSGKQRADPRRRHQLLALLPRLSATAVLDWQCDAPFAHHTQLTPAAAAIAARRLTTTTTSAVSAVPESSESASNSNAASPPEMLSPLSTHSEASFLEGSDSENSNLNALPGSSRSGLPSSMKNTNTIAAVAAASATATAAFEAVANDHAWDPLSYFRSRGVSVSLDFAALGPSSYLDSLCSARPNHAKNSDFNNNNSTRSSTHGGGSGSGGLGMLHRAMHASAAADAHASALDLESDVGVWAALPLDLLAWVVAPPRASSSSLVNSDMDPSAQNRPSSDGLSAQDNTDGRGDFDIHEDAVNHLDSDSRKEELLNPLPQPSSPLPPHPLSKAKETAVQVKPRSLPDVIVALNLRCRHSPAFVSVWPSSESSTSSAANNGSNASDHRDGLVFELRRLDATKSSSRSIVPSQLLHRQAQRRQKQRAPMSTSLPYLRLALDNRLQDVFVDVGDSSSSNTANSSSDSSDASTNLVPLRRFAAVAGPLHATSANAEMGDSKLHSARIIAQPHAFVAALPQLLPLSKATASNSTNDNDDSKKKDDEALGISSEELSAANSAEAGDADTSSTDNSSSSSSSSSSSGTGARLNPIIEGGGGGALGDLLRGQSAQRPSSSTSRWPSVAAVLQRVRSRPEDDDDDDEEEEKAAAAAVGAGRGPALLRALLDQRHLVRSAQQSMHGGLGMSTNNSQSSSLSANGGRDVVLAAANISVRQASDWQPRDEAHEGHGIGKEAPQKTKEPSTKQQQSQGRVPTDAGAGAAAAAHDGKDNEAEQPPFEPSLFFFGTNHVSLQPPPHCLPTPAQPLPLGESTNLPPSPAAAGAQSYSPEQLLSPSIRHRRASISSGGSSTGGAVLMRRRRSSISTSSIQAATAAAASALQIERRRSSELDPEHPFSGVLDTSAAAAVGAVDDDNDNDNDDDHSEDDSGDEALVPVETAEGGGDGFGRRILGSGELLPPPAGTSPLQKGTGQRLRSESVLSDGGASAVSGDFGSTAGDSGDEYNSENDDGDDDGDDEDDEDFSGDNIDEAWAAAPLLRTDVEVCEFRLVYTLAARDRLLYLMECWHELMAAKEANSAAAAASDSSGNEEGSSSGQGGINEGGGGEEGHNGGNRSGFDSSSSGCVGLSAPVGVSTGPQAPIDHLSKLFLSRGSSDASVPERFVGGSGGSLSSGSSLGGGGSSGNGGGGGSAGRGMGHVSSGQRLTEAAKAEARAQAAAAAAASAHAAAAAATFENTIRYRVQFVNPQANLLCPKTRGSVVLGVAAATLVGRDLGVFYCCPNEKTNGAAEDPNSRKQAENNQTPNENPQGSNSGSGNGGASSVATSKHAGGLAVYQKHERLLTVDGALAYIMSMDVDVNAGVCWLKDLQDARQNSSSVLLRPVMSPFGLTHRTEHFFAVSKAAWRSACVAMTDAVRLEDSEGFDEGDEDENEQYDDGEDDEGKEGVERGGKEDGKGRRRTNSGAAPMETGNRSRRSNSNSSASQLHMPPPLYSVLHHQHRRRSSNQSVNKKLSAAANKKKRSKKRSLSSSSFTNRKGLSSKSNPIEHEPPVEAVGSLAERVRIDLPEVTVELDSGEFETLSDALQNLLLAPPYQPTRGRKDSAADAKRTNAEYHVVQANSLRVDAESRDSRYALKALVEGELASLALQRQLHPPRATKVVEYSLGTGVWVLRPLREESGGAQDSALGARRDLVKVGFSGLSGKHRFWSDHQVESVVTLESFCMLNAKPGPQSQAFPDAEVIFKPRRKVAPLCKHCVRPFEPEANHQAACACHTNDWGEEGFFGPSFRPPPPAPDAPGPKPSVASPSSEATAGAVTPTNGAVDSPLSPDSGGDSATTSTTSSSQYGSSGETVNSSSADQGGSSSCGNLRKSTARVHSGDIPGAGWAVTSPSPSPAATAAVTAAASAAACEWTCCGATSLRAPKCNGRRHALAPGANMLQVRATATRPMLVGHHNNSAGGSGNSSSGNNGGSGSGSGAEVKVFTELQISLFPEEKHTVQVQLSADVAAFLNAYFFPAQSRQAAATLANLRGPVSNPHGSGHNGHGHSSSSSGGSGDGLGSFSGTSTALSAGGAAASDRFLIGNRFALGSGGSSLFGGSAVGGSRELAQDSSSDEENDEGDHHTSTSGAGGGSWGGYPSIRGTSTSRGASTSRSSTATTSSNSNTVSSSSGGSGSSGVEAGGVYLKYFRIGEVELALTTVGFGKKLGVQLDRDRLRLTSPAFHRSERVVTWKQLGQKYVKHLVAHLVTGGAGRKKSLVLSPQSPPNDEAPPFEANQHDAATGEPTTAPGPEDRREADEETLGPSSNYHPRYGSAAGARGPISSSSNSGSSSSGSSARKGGMFGAASSMLRAGTSAAAHAAAATAASTKPSSNKADKSREALLFGGRR